jgi:putative tricarboxylic transport membrane protein
VRKRGDIVASVFGIFVGVTMMIGAIRLRLGTPSEPQPGFFPFVAGVILVVLCMILLVRAFSGRGEGAEPFGELWKPAILAIGLLLYSLLLDSIGYIIATIILSMLVLRVLDTKTWLKLVAISLVLSVGTYFLFDRLLDVPLPLGILAGIL